MHRPEEPLTQYRFTSYMLPVLVLLLLPGLAAYPWNLPLGGPLTLPFLILLTLYFCAVRYPELLLSPVAFAAGILTDLFTRSPMGFWTLLFLIALSCAATTTVVIDRFGKFTGWLCFIAALIIWAVAAWGLSSLYLMSKQDHWQVIEALAMALMMMPLPVIVFLGFESMLIIKPAKKR